MLKSKRKVCFDVKSTIFNIMLELISPNRCERCGAPGVVLCDCCKKYLMSSNPGYVVSEAFGFMEVIVGGIKEGVLSDLLKKYKYGCNRSLADVLATTVDDRLRDVVNSEKEVGGRAVIVPLPTIGRHIRARGFDHIKVLANKFSDIAPVENLIIRQRDSVQVGKGAEERLRQAESAYTLREGAQCDPEVKYILFDDVWTTGGSMRAASEVLRKAGARKLCAVILMSNDYIETTENLPLGQV